MNTLIIRLLFLIPFVFSALSIQALITKFVSVNVGQIIAYLNVLLIIIGIFGILKTKDKQSYPKTITLWFVFFIAYYSLGFFANMVHNYEPPFLKTLIPVIYFIGFAQFLGNNENRSLFPKIVIITFTIANLLLIYFQRINFSMDYEGVYKYTLSRAGGVYGDANNAAVVCLLSFIFIKNFFITHNFLQKLIKQLCIGISLYALVLTFSNTGFIVLIIVLMITYNYWFNPKRIIFLVIIVPIFSYFLFTSALNSSYLNNIQKARITNVVNIITLNTSEVSDSGRGVLLQNMMNFVNENPFLGNGIYFSTEIRGHNTLIGIWADAGIFTFLIFIILLLYYYKKAILSPSRIRIPTLSILLVLTIFMLTLQTIINQSYLIVLFAFMAYLMSNSDESQPDEHSIFANDNTPTTNNFI
tara:strand:+ start:15147 stop:16388 length:1242 start_codon:yes stop_codon:yes gene_type:complete